MKKKITAIFLCIALAATAIVGASLAYFTDTEKATNTFTVGNVDITLQEGTKKDLNNGTVNLTNWQEQKNKGNATLMPGTSSDGNAVSKIITVKNETNQDAWVWVELKIPSALLADDFKNVNEPNWSASFQSDTFNALHINEYAVFMNYYYNHKNADGSYSYRSVNANSSPVKDGILDVNGNVTTQGMVNWSKDYLWDGFKVVKVEDDYVTLRSCMINPLPANSTSLPCLRQVYMDWRLYANADGGYTFPATTVDGHTYNGTTISKDINWNIEVNAYAIQADGIASVDKAVKLFATNENGEYHPTNDAVQ